MPYYVSEHVFHDKIFRTCIYACQKEQYNKTVQKRSQCIISVCYLMSGLLKVSSLQSEVWDHFEKEEKTTKSKHCDRVVLLWGHNKLARSFTTKSCKRILGKGRQ